MMMIGVDGVSWKILQPWINRGELPAFKKFKDTGVHGTLNSTIPSATCPALPSFYTGMNPGNLGIHSYETSEGPVTMNEIKYPKIWDYLGESSLSSIIYNLRFTYPPQKINGMMISGTPVPSEASHYVHPPSLKSKLAGFHEKEKSLDELMDGRGKDKKLFLERAMEITKTRYRTFMDLKPQYHDFILYYIGLTDSVQHVLWDDKGSMLKYFKVVDEIIGSLFSRDGNIPKILFSDHGFHKSARYKFHVNTLLKTEGLLEREGGLLKQKIMDTIQMLARDIIPPSVLAKKLDDGSEQGIGRFDNFPGVDKETSKAWLSEPWGVRVKDDEIEPVIRCLQRMEWKGKKIVKHVWKRDEIFTGKHIEDIPEVIFLTKPEFHSEAQLSGKLVTKLRFRSKRKHAGEHTNAREGIYSVVSGEAKHGPAMNIYDLLPLAMYLLRLEVPIGLDGSIPQEMMIHGKPKYRDYYSSPSKVDPLSDEDKEAIRDRLRALGYLD